MSSNPRCVKLGVHSTSVLSRTWTKNIYFVILFLRIGLQQPNTATWVLKETLMILLFAARSYAQTVMWNNCNPNPFSITLLTSHSLAHWPFYVHFHHSLTIANVRHSIMVHFTLANHPNVPQNDIRETIPWQCNILIGRNSFIQNAQHCYQENLLAIVKIKAVMCVLSSLLSTQPLGWLQNVFKLHILIYHYVGLVTKTKCKIYMMFYKDYRS